MKSLRYDYQGDMRTAKDIEHRKLRKKKNKEAKAQRALRRKRMR